MQSSNNPINYSLCERLKKLPKPCSDEKFSDEEVAEFHGRLNNISNINEVSKQSNIKQSKLLICKAVAAIIWNVIYGGGERLTREEDDIISKLSLLKEEKPKRKEEKEPNFFDPNIISTLSPLNQERSKLSFFMTTPPTEEANFPMPDVYQKTTQTTHKPTGSATRNKRF